MDNIRLILFILLSFISLLLWEAWQRDYGPQSAAPAAATAPTTSDAPAIDRAASKDLPRPTPPPSPPAAPAAVPAGQVISVETDLFHAEISTVGAVIRKLSLKHYPQSIEKGAPLFDLLAADETRLLVAQSGMKTDGEGPDHYAQYAAAAPRFALAAGADTLPVEFTWRNADGVEVVRRYVFKRGSYEIAQEFEIRNHSGAVWKAHPYDQLQKQQMKSSRSVTPTFTGAALSSPENKYEKFKLEDLAEEPIDRDVTGGWAALVEHYFVAALIPAADAPQHYYSTAIGENRYVLGYYGAEIAVPPGETRSLASRLYAGPKLQEVLPAVAPGLELTVDYGKLWFIAKALFWWLETLHRLFGNWGVAIILLTLTVKLLFYPLSAAGYRSMAKMRKVQPRLMQLKERFGKDRAAMNQAMMELYKTERINPLGGCLPIVVQIPVFIALYWVLLESVELRQAPFWLWIRDLSIKDPYFVLPVLMTASMWLQSKMNPPPLDPIQAKVMQIMPLAFGVFFAFFPAGLVLYWFVNNVLSIAQQWYITKQSEAA
ncbi:MAG TPA: membrane protein insertase YidC [Gammaproteobacteria bacterium]|nr:membrane protein insertase YidC [Gammaproteobacteria bacterium]